MTAPDAATPARGQETAGESWNQVDDLCRKTLAFCSDRGLSPVPPIYELVYTFFEGKREDVVEGLTEVIEQGEIQSFQLIELHEKFLGHDELAVAFDSIGTDLGNELGSLEKIASSGQEGALRSRSELSRLVSGLRDRPGSSDMNGLAQRMRDIVLQQSRNVSDMKDGLDDARARLNKIERELETYVKQANTDFLTGLPNRRALDGKLGCLFARPFRPDVFDCVLMIDIDHFKLVNDTHGHDVGDNVLREFSRILRAECEKTEAYAGRWGGEEFCIILSAQEENRGYELAEEIRARFEGLNWKRMSDGVDIGQITISAGLAVRDAAADPASIASHADQALYAAKAEGRNRCKRYTDL